jgi:hypothetical protein
MYLPEQDRAIMRQIPAASGSEEGSYRREEMRISRRKPTDARLRPGSRPGRGD